MATLRDIRRKIQSVANIQKITQAMELVAASRLRKAQARAESARPYALKLKEILDRLISSMDKSKHPLVTPRKVKTIGLVVIAGDRGLCGGYNHNVFGAAEKFLQGYSHDAVKLFPVGRKTVEYFTYKKWPIASKLSEWGGKIAYAQIEEFTRELMDLYLQGHVDEIWVVYTHFINMGAREVKIDKFLNIESSSTTPVNGSYIFEPDAPSVFAEILPSYCVTKIQSALNDAYASELAARISSMRAAAKNAEEMIRSLTLTRNKIRQYGITKELIEITSGAESLR